MAKASKWVYETVANVVNGEVNHWSEGGRIDMPGQIFATLRELTSGLATVFSDDNPRFDADKFVKACGF